MLVSDTTTPGLGQIGASATLGFRLKPVVLVVPAPNAKGREINLISHATDLSLGARLGIGRGMEVTLVLPAGLYQRGAGIKGVTHQSASAIPAQSLHDPRAGFGFGLFNRRGVGLKLRLELKLPLGDRRALMGETGPVLGSTIVPFFRFGGLFLGGELGVRLRNPTDFFGRRVGTQLVDVIGIGYALRRPQLAFTLETYLLEGLTERDDDSPREWLASIRFTPQSQPRLTLGVAGGTGIPQRDDDGQYRSGIGTPIMRLLAFARWTPPK